MGVISWWKLVILVFMLTTFLDGQPQPDKSYWFDINRCQYFAKSIRRQNYWLSQKYNQPEIGATCMPIMVNPKRTKIWR